MPRQLKWIAAGTYQPTYEPRRAYGPRRSGRHDLVEEVFQRSYVLDAKAMARYGHTIEARLISVNMPNGGVRWLLVCPCCQTRAARLYGQRVARGVSYGCRTCLGLCYQSQYAGRRLEAHPDYLEAAMRRQIERVPHDPRGYLPVPARRQKERARHILRMSHYERAQRLIHQRTYRHTERREIALEISLMTLVAREETQDRVNMAVEPLQSPAEAAPGGFEDEGSALVAHLIGQERMTALRARYASLGKAR
jgi:hypothetical protein